MLPSFFFLKAGIANFVFFFSPDVIAFDGDGGQGDANGAAGVG